MKKLTLTAALLLFGFIGHGQLTLGLMNSNYAGSAGTMINPSSMANSRLKADISLFSVNSFVSNNYFYLPSGEATVISLISGGYDFPYFPKPYGKGERNVYSYYMDKDRKNIFVQGRISGPSGMFSHNDHVFAIRTGVRAVSSVRRLPYDMANFSYYGMDYKPQQNIYFMRDNYNMASMAWGEIMFSYATVFKRSHYNHWSAGITAGPVFGHSGAYIIGGDTRYIAYNDSILNVELLDAELGLALPVDYSNDRMNWTDPLVRGLGFGMDVGITWQFRERPYQKKFPGNFYVKRFEDYQYKLGLSIIDIGWIGFSKNAERHVYDYVSNNWIRVDEMEYNNIRDELDDASEIFYGDPNASLKERSIRIYLPTSLSMQLDVHITDWWYVNSTVIIPAWFISPVIERPMIISLTPRFESDHFEVNIPISIYEWKYPHFGISVRFAGLTVGTDHITGFLGRKDFTGADFYISYKVNFRNDGKNPFTSKGACFNNWRLELKKYHR